MWRKLLMLCLLALFGIAYSSQRIVVAEEFTGTWCTYCPGAARALDEMYERVYDSLVVIAYHLSDAYSIPEGNVRKNYYGVTGIPHTRIDGLIQIVGGLHTGTIYPTIRKNFYQRIPIESPLDIKLECTYGAGKDSGTVEAKIFNTSMETVNGTLHFAIVENHIEHYWLGMSHLDFVARDMLPDASGELVSISPGDSLIISRDFAIDPSWDEENCKIVVFVQGSTREIYQGAEVGVIQKAEMQYFGMSIVPDGQYDIFIPGDTLTAGILAKNFGTGDYTERIILNNEDPYLEVIDFQPTQIPISPGNVDTVMTLTVYAGDSCPDPYQAELLLDFRTSTDTIPILITTQFGFSDDIESGDSGWVHYGIRDNWHISEHDSYSPHHSWYCGHEGSWQYTNENDASVVTPYFIVTPDTLLSLYHKYSMENAYDYGYIEIDNGSGWWKTLEEITGGDNSWQEFTYPLDEYSLLTTRLRFRFISDYNTTSEGWYVDDITIPVKIFAIEENDFTIPTELIVRPTLVNTHTNISYKSNSSYVRITIYNISGRIVKVLPIKNTTVVWDCTDNKGNLVPSGVYFVKLTTEKDCKSAKMVVLTR